MEEQSQPICRTSWPPPHCASGKVWAPLQPQGLREPCLVSAPGRVGEPRLLPHSDSCLLWAPYLMPSPAWPFPWALSQKTGLKSLLGRLAAGRFYTTLNFSPSLGHVYVSVTRSCGAVVRTGWDNASDTLSRVPTVRESLSRPQWSWLL